MIIERKSYKEKYIPKHKEVIKFFVWLNSIIKEQNKSAVAHFQLVDHIYNKSKYKVIEASRGLAKSSLILYSMAYWLYNGHKYNFGEVNYILLVQDSVTMAEATFEQLLSLIENTEIRKILIVEKKRLGDDPTLYVRNKKTGKLIILKGRGSGQSMRGTRVLGMRPSIIILDDIENEEKHATKDSRNKLKNWFFNVVIPAVDENKFEFIFIGTPIHEDALLMDLLNSSHWKAIQLPVCENFDPNDTSKIVSAWDDRFTVDKIIEKYEMLKSTGKETSFYQEYMLEVTPRDSLLYNMDRINEYKMMDFKKNLGRLTYYISVDLAVSEKEYADYTSICVVGVDGSGQWFLVDGFYGRIKPDVTIDKIFYYVGKWKPASVVLEKVAFQLSMKTFINREMIKRGMFFNLEMVSRTKSKLAVFKSLQPIIEMGNLWLPTDYVQDFVKELRHEMSMVSNEKILSVHDDVLDSLAQLTLVNIIYQEPAYKNNELVETVEYKSSYVI